jgi:hypothetical protein
MTPAITSKCSPECEPAKTMDSFVVAGQLAFIKGGDVLALGLPGAVLVLKLPKVRLG